MLVLIKIDSKNFRVCFVGNVWLFNLSNRVMPYSAGSGVKSVIVILSVFI